MKTRILVGFLVMLLHVNLAAEQLTGVVKDHRGKPLAAVEVVLKNTGDSTHTDAEGKFILPIPPQLKAPSVVLIFKRSGYHPLEKRTSVQKGIKIFRLRFLSEAFMRDKISITVSAPSNAQLTGTATIASNRICETEIREKMAESISETIADTPGVHFIGKGGYAVTPSIRGLARRRVLVLVDGARITSDRRVGASPSFISPAVARDIEVVRSGASVFYGSDAIGGVINILTRSPFDDETPSSGTDTPSNPSTPPPNTLNLTVNSANKRIDTGFNYGFNSRKFFVLTGFQYNHAGNYKSPGETIHYSQYTNFSGLLDILYKGENREFYLGYLGGFGSDTGKPERENRLDKYSLVPSESNQFFRFGYREKELLKNTRFHFSLFLNPTAYTLDKVDETTAKLERSETEALNLGLKSYLETSWGKSLRSRAGIEWYSRKNLEITNRETVGNETTVSLPLGKGKRDDYSLFLTLNYSLNPTLDFSGGIRFTYFDMAAQTDETQGEPLSKDKGALSCFAGVTQKIGSHVSLFCNIGRAFRFPSLSESFYTGITGRKYVVGNPSLKPESSFNVDTGLKVATRKYFLGMYFFTYRVNNMIERYRNPQNIYTYDNLYRGRLYGGEMEVRYFPVPKLELFGHYFYYKGESRTDGMPLNDVPAPRLFLGGKIVMDRVRVSLDYLHSFKKEDPGPAETENDAYDLLNIKGGWYASGSLFFYFKVSNVFNSRYYANPDPDIPLSKGLDVSGGVQVYF